MSASCTILKNRINELIQKVINTENTIIVVKGIPLSFLLDEKIDLENTSKNKLVYFFQKIVTGGRKVIAYEEFLMLSNFILDQYQNVYIIDNNLYINYYPIEQLYSDSIKKGLLNHFTEQEDDSNDNLEIGDIQEYIALYQGLKEENGILFGAYSDFEKSDIRVKRLYLFDEGYSNFPTVNDATDYLEIKTEEDYIQFIKVLLNTDSQEININITGYVDDNLEIIKNRLGIISFYWQELCDFNYIESKNEGLNYIHNPKYTEILNRFWGYNSFRTIKNYELDELEKGNKKVIEISQEQIISELIQQVENCENPEMEHKDMFVTAPTGAGKSVMFQIPAIYLAEQKNLMTIVISPLIGLMNDQVKSLELKNCNYAKTINSDISPILKNEITEKVGNGEYHILYISPETLLSRSDVESLIGNRTIGMIVIDEAHIVTTWGKQFRPDYWYLGDHIRKLRKKQTETKGVPFVIATFTATAIYGGYEDMYRETINSLHLINPIVHLGYVKRNDIDITIKQIIRSKTDKNEYRANKLEDVKNLIRRSMLTNKKTLIYFPTVGLIEDTLTGLKAAKMISNVTYYYGPLKKDIKNENYEKFLNGEKLVMLATKAFGMGIDIDNIEIVAHYAPTGNVCDYVQEIGRVARRSDITGEAYYKYDNRDFKHINRMHGLSAIKEYQLVGVIEKIYELYENNLKQNGGSFTRKRNAMLIDAENFSYIFSSYSKSGEDADSTNKVKTALLLIQKDFESNYGFSPIVTRPIPLFSMGYFKIDPITQKKLNNRFGECVKLEDDKNNICLVRLDKIWKKYYDKYSFPKFKYLIYSKDKELDFNQIYSLTSALCIDISFENYYVEKFNMYWSQLRKFVNEKSVLNEKFIYFDEIVEKIINIFKVSKYKASSIADVLIASIKQYMNSEFNRHLSGKLLQEKILNNNSVSYKFSEGISFYFKWVERRLFDLSSNTINGKFYIINDNGFESKEYNLILGVLEVMDILEFKMMGGANSQIYVYINQIQKLQNIKNDPYSYKNRLLEKISNRHILSVQMLTYLYENNFKSNEIWDLIEDYFLGNVPKEVQKKFELLIRDKK